MKTRVFLKKIVEGLGIAIRRFPISILSSLIITIAAMYMLEVEEHEDIALPIMMCFAILTMISLIIQLARERLSLKKIWLILGYVLTGLFLVWYYRSLHGAMSEDQLSVCAVFTFFGTLILLIFITSLTPYLKKEDNPAFLTYNRKVFTSFVFTFVLAFILYFGLALAILAIDRLFHANIDGNVYAHLLFIIGIFFFNLHFLSQFPNDFEDANPSPPEAYRIIVQYVMIPIVSIYALILIFYTISNVFHHQLIEDWTYWLMLWFYVLGFLAYLLNQSIVGDENDDWSKAFCKWFLYFLIPLSLTSLFSVWKDLQIGGVTELRYAIASFSLFLLLASTYLSFFKSKDYRFVPFVLAIITIVSIYGPWSMCKASLRSQMDKLEAVLVNNKVLQNGILTPPLDIRQEDKGQVQDFIRFFTDRKALDGFKKWDENNVLGNPPLEEAVIADLFDIYDITKGLNVQTLENYALEEVDLKGFEKMISIVSVYMSAPESGYYLQLSDDQSKVDLMLDEEEMASYTISDFLDQEKLKKEKVITIEDTDYLITIYPRYIQWDNNTNKTLSLEGIALLNKK